GLRAGVGRRIALTRVQSPARWNLTLESQAQQMNIEIRRTVDRLGPEFRRKRPNGLAMRAIALKRFIDHFAPRAGGRDQKVGSIRAHSKSSLRGRDEFVDC